MTEKIVVTDAQVKAAQMIVDRDRAIGRETDEATRMIAEAKPEQVVEDQTLDPDEGDRAVRLEQDVWQHTVSRLAKLVNPPGGSPPATVVRRTGRTNVKSSGGSGKFVLKKGESGKFYFNLLAANGEIIAESQHYESKEAALEGIKSVQANRGSEIETEVLPGGQAGRWLSFRISAV